MTAHAERTPGAPRRVVRRLGRLLAGRVGAHPVCGAESVRGADGSTEHGGPRAPGPATAGSGGPTGPRGRGVPPARPAGRDEHEGHGRPLARPGGGSPVRRTVRGRAVRILLCLAVAGISGSCSAPDGTALPSPAAPRYAGPASTSPHEAVPAGRGRATPARGATGPPQSPPPPDPVRVALTGLSPVLPYDGDTLTVTGALTNTTGRQIVAARLGERVGGGSEIARSEQDVAPLSPGERVPFRLAVPVSSLGLAGAGDYRLDVALTGRDGAALGAVSTRLPWSPGDVGDTPLDVAVLWPVTDAPHMEALSLGWGDDAQPVFRNDDLTRELATGGRLRAVTSAASGLPVTWMVDPGLLDEARAMSGGYRVADAPDASDPLRSHPGNGRAAATSWLADLRKGVRHRDVVALPYADPDLAALAHSGTGAALLGPVLRDAVRWGAATTRSVLGVPVRDDVAWPYRGGLDASITGLADTLGARTVVASGQGLSTGTTHSRVSLTGGGTALVGDLGVSDALSGPVDDPEAQVTARQRILGALLAARLRAGRQAGGVVSGGREGTVLVVPPRGLSGRAADALAGALRVARDAGWIRLVGLDEVVADAGDAADAAGGRGGRTGGTGMVGRTRDNRGDRGDGGTGGVVAGGDGRTGGSGRATGGAGGAAAKAGGGWSGGGGADGAAPPARVAGQPPGPAAPTRPGTAGTPSQDRPDPSSGTGRTPLTSGDDQWTGSYPQALRANEISADDVTAVAAIQPDLGTLTRVLSDPERTTDAVHRAMLRAVSTGWRAGPASGDATQRKSYTGGVRAYVDDSITSVHLLPKRGTVTMAGDTASIPVTVANGLQQTLGGLRLRVTSSAPNRLSVTNPAVAVRAPPAANHTQQVGVRADANGPVRVTAQLYTTANDRPWGDPVVFRIKVSRISPLVVTGVWGGLLLILLAGAVKVRRVRQRAAAAAPDDARS